MAAFYVIFLGTLWRAVRQPGRLQLAVVAVFGSTAAIFGYSFLDQLLPGRLEFMQPLAVMLLLAQPLLVFFLVHQLRPLARWVLPTTVVVFVVATMALILPGRTVPAAALLVGLYFIVAEGAAALLLLGEGRRRHGLASVRLSLAALGTILFAGTVFIAAAASVAADGGPSDAGATFASRVAALLAALAYLAAFVPPRWLRNFGQRAVAFDLARSTVAATTDPGLLWRTLAFATRDILDARQVSVTGADGEVLGSTAADGDVRPPPGEHAGGGPVTIIDVPLVAASGAVSHLRAEIDGRPLFLEDDLSALSLLGSMTVRAVDREDAALRLAEARHELEAAEAIKASEARFRALLAAHPNAVLAIDDDGVVTWATGTTGELFGRPPEDLPGIPLSELIHAEATSLAELGGGRVRRGHATGHRADGSQFPADVAWTSFDVDFVTYQLAIITDASWRHEANLMRDRFLGVLSHELRTPITAIYGGTQLLLRRESRLDDDERSELLTDVATESERLQRIIENLLILARVERGADFFDRRPLALRPVLSDIVERERGQWPHMSLQLAMPDHLPLVAGDEEYVGLIMRNLLSNAAKYAGKSAEVEVVVETSAEDVCVLVRDDGPGLRDEDGERLFSLYYRAAESVGSAPGAGIGLFVCRGLANAMGGRMWAGQRSDGGAEFGFSLPVFEEAGWADDAALAGTSKRRPG